MHYFARYFLGNSEHLKLFSKQLKQSDRFVNLLESQGYYNKRAGLNVDSLYVHTVNSLILFVNSVYFHLQYIFYWLTRYPPSSIESRTCTTHTSVGFGNA